MNLIVKGLLRRFARAAQPHLKFTGLFQTSALAHAAALVMEPAGERVLVLAPHMDDETIGCGGTLASHRRRGGQVSVVFLTDGGHGNGSVGALSGEARRRTQQEVIATRKAESRQALGVLGVTDVRYLDAPDGNLANHVQESAAKLRRILLEVQPDLAYLPLFVDEDPDHRAANDVLIQAARGSGLNFLCAGYEVWTPMFPNCIVDIGATAALKETALGCYSSSVEHADYVRACLGLNAYRSIALLGAKGGYAEAFFVCPLRQYAAFKRDFITHAVSRRPEQRVARRPATASPAPSA